MPTIVRVPVAAAANPPDFKPDFKGEAALRAALRERLLSLGFHAFARCVAHLLERTGYEQVRLSGRTDWKGHNRAGGYDLLAVSPSGPLKRRLVAQLKQFGPDQSVYQRNIDELRGAVLRAGASEGLLVTTGQFSAQVRAELLQNAPLVPVRLIGGEELLDLMIARRIGVKATVVRRTGQPPVRLEVDDGWFAALQRENEGNRRDQTARTAEPRFRVTVAVEPLR